MPQNPSGFSEDQSPFRFASSKVGEDIAPPSEAVLLLAEAEFRNAIAAFDEAGRIKAECAGRLNAMVSRLKTSADRLKATLESAARLN